MQTPYVPSCRLTNNDDIRQMGQPRSHSKGAGSQRSPIFGFPFTDANTHFNVDVFLG